MALSHASTVREGCGEALTGVRAGQPLSREITASGCRRRLTRRKATSPAALARAVWWTPRGLSLLFNPKLRRFLGGIFG